MLGCEGKVHRGRVIFDVEPSNVKQCLKLRTVNNLYVLVGHTHKVLDHHSYQLDTFEIRKKE